MIDTIRLRSPEMDKNIIEVIKQSCTKKSSVRIGTGEIEYEFIAGDLKNSADNRISIKVLNDKWVREEYGLADGSPIIVNGRGALTTHKIHCGNYVEIECSIHKMMLGHNIFGGSSDLQNSVKWLIKFLSDKMVVKFPDYKYWTVLRIDIAEVYIMPSIDVCFEWFRQMQSMNYSRREQKMSKHGLTGIYFPGESSTLKFYHKGTEFRKHDKPKIKKFIGEEKAGKLQQIADNIIRVELELHNRKLKYDFGHLPFVWELSDEYLKEKHDDEVKKVMNCAGSEIKMVRRAADVEKILYENYNPQLAGVLLGTWYRLSVSQSEREVRNKIPKATFQRHKKLLKDLDITWLATDVVIDESIVPIDFIPLREDRHYFGLVAREVQDLINSVA